MTDLKTRKLLNEIAEYLYGAVPCDGWGIRDKSVDDERRNLLTRINALLDDEDGEAATNTLGRAPRSS
jgi:hypothetical protein